MSDLENFEIAAVRIENFHDLITSLHPVFFIISKGSVCGIICYVCGDIHSRSSTVLWNL